MRVVSSRSVAELTVVARRTLATTSLGQWTTV